jgi:hypothetical protein
MFPCCLQATIEYVVTVTTADVTGADSDGMLVVRLVGDKGETEDKHLSQAQYVSGVWNTSMVSRTGVAWHECVAYDPAMRDSLHCQSISSVPYLQSFHQYPSTDGFYLQTLCYVT